MNKNNKYKFNDIINTIKETYLKYGDDEVYKDNDWCLYSKDENLLLDSCCYVLDYPEIDDETDEEKLPLLAVKNNMNTVYRPELIQDIITSALYQKRDATNIELLNAVHYYFENDSFLEF